MAESLPQFVASRRPGWTRLEGLLAKQSSHALRLEDVRALDLEFRRAAADLSVARARFPGTDAERYLNQLAAQGYATVYRPPRNRGRAVARFYASELPRLFRQELSSVAASAALLVLGIGIGVVVALLDPSGAKLVVPAGVLQHIGGGRMWTDDLLSVAPNVVSSSIATNNLTVTLTAFASGLTFGLGTVYLLVSNGILLGAVGALCVRAGMGYAFFSFVGGHGPTELSIIAISGGAGLVVARALIEPGEHTRAHHLKVRAAAAVRLVLGCAPFLALDAFVEGFVSPGDIFPGAAKIALGLALATAFWAYLLRGGRAAGADAVESSTRSR